MRAYKTLFTGAYKEQFEIAVDGIVAAVEKAAAERSRKIAEMIGTIEEREAALSFMIRESVAARNAEIEELIEDYLGQTGKRPVGAQLERLANAILYEELEGDARPDKVTLSETPMLTGSQVRRRHNNEASSEALASVGSDRRNYRRPVQRQKTTGEMIAVDALVTREKDRKPSSVTVFSL